VPEPTTNTQPTDTSSWAVLLGQRLRSKVRPGAVEVVVKGEAAKKWVVQRGRVVRLTASEQVSRLREPKRVVLLLGIAAGACLVLSLLLIYAHGLTRQAPKWWNTSLAVDPAAGEAIEMGLMGHLSAVRPPDPALKPGEPWRSAPWSISLSEDDANAWLNARLPKWMLNRGTPVEWPVELRSLQVKFEEGTVRLGVQIIDSNDSVIAGVSLTPEMRDNSSLWLKSSGLDIGSLPAPSWMIGAARSTYGSSIPAAIRELPETKAFFGALAGNNAIFPNTTIRLDGGRRVRVLSIKPRNGRVDMTFRTEFVSTRK
jgi:hypothetical protein